MTCAMRKPPPRGTCDRRPTTSVRRASLSHDTPVPGWSAARLLVLVSAAALLALGGGGQAAATTGMGMDIDLVGTRPSDLGPTAERRFLRLCTSDACIGSSEQVGAGNYVAPWTFNNDGREDVARASAMKELLKVLDAMADMVVKQQDDDYVLLEAKRGLGMLDDVEFLFSPNGKDVEIRSSSRVPYPPMRHRQRLTAILSELSRISPRWHAQPKRCAPFLYAERGEFMFCDSPDSPVFSAPVGAAQVHGGLGLRMLANVHECTLVLMRECVRLASVREKKSVMENESIQGPVEQQGPDATRSV